MLTDAEEQELLTLLDAEAQAQRDPDAGLLLPRDWPLCPSPLPQAHGVLSCWGWGPGRL